MVFDEIAWLGCLAVFLAGFLPDVTSDAELQPPDMDRAFGKTAAHKSKAGWNEKLPRGQRVLNGLAGVRAGGRLGASSRDSEVVSMEMSVPNVALIP
jgi:hypothetical protein